MRSESMTAVPSASVARPSSERAPTAGQTRPSLVVRSSMRGADSGPSTRACTPTRPVGRCGTSNQDAARSTSNVPSPVSVSRGSPERGPNVPATRARPSGAATSSAPIDTVSPSNDTDPSSVVISVARPPWRTRAGSAIDRRPESGRPGLRCRASVSPALSNSTPLGIVVLNGEAGDEKTVDSQRLAEPRSCIVLAGGTGKIPRAVGAPDDPDARAIDLNRLDAEGADDRGHRQIEPDGVRLEEWHLTACCGHGHPIETDRQREQVVVQTRRLEADAVPRQLGGRPRQHARPHEGEMGEGEDENADGRHRSRDDPPAARIPWHLAAAE